MRCWKLARRTLTRTVLIWRGTLPGLWYVWVNVWTSLTAQHGFLLKHLRYLIMVFFFKLFLLSETHSPILHLLWNPQPLFGVFTYLLQTWTLYETLSVSLHWIFNLKTNCWSQSSHYRLLHVDCCRVMFFFPDTAQRVYCYWHHVVFLCNVWRRLLCSGNAWFVHVKAPCIRKPSFE